MSDVPKDPATAFAEELAKQLPVKAAYRDAVKPAAKQLGQIAQDVVKPIQLALAPLQFAGAYQDRLRAFLDRAVRQVPEDRRVSPPPQILGPIVESIRYEPEGTPLDQMFQHLLSTSMDADHIKDAHPAMPLIIKQLSGDEANILRWIASSPKYFEMVVRFDLRGDGLATSHLERIDLPMQDLIFPQNESMYRDRLERLGLIRYDALKPMEPIFEDGKQTGGRNVLVLKLTEFGATLMRASGFPPVLPA